MDLSNEQKIRYLQRSYSAVDGLWFMKVEENYGFDKALDIDKEVWKVMPKIQARFLKSVSGADMGLEALRECFSEKLRLDGIEFDMENEENRLAFIITKCHWHEIMVDSGRENLSPDIGKTICSTEYSVWATEFGGDISFELVSRICSGDKTCVIQYSRK